MADDDFINALMAQYGDDNPSTADIRAQMPPQSLGDYLRRLAPDAPEFGTSGIRGMMPGWPDAINKAGEAYSRVMNNEDLQPALLAAALVGPKAPTRIPNPIRAYHGSPHDFNEFDLSKIGTGEGAQAYGHGLYFAEEPKVAESYKGVVPDDGSPMALAQNIWRTTQGDMDYASSTALRMLGVQKAQPVIEQFQRWKSGQDPFPGRMYEVALHASPEQFLDWDKPLSGQEPGVLQALRQQGVGAVDAPKGQTWKGSDVIMGRTPQEQSEFAGKLSEAGIPGIRYLDQGSRFANSPSALLQGARVDSAPVWNKPYPSQDYFETKIGNVPVSISRVGDQWQILKGGGRPQQLPGLDTNFPSMEAAKRALENDVVRKPETSNYVVWSPEIIEILKKYGIIAPTAAATLAHALSQSQPSSTDEQQ